MFGEVQRRRYYDVSLLNMVDIVASMKPNMGTDTIGKHLFKLPEVLKNESHKTST